MANLQNFSIKQREAAIDLIPTSVRQSLALQGRGGVAPLRAFALEEFEPIAERIGHIKALGFKQRFILNYFDARGMQAVAQRGEVFDGESRVGLCSGREIFLDADV